MSELEAFIQAAKGKNMPWSGAKVYDTKIRRNIKLAESPSFGQHIIQYDPGSNGANDYRALARELLGLPEPEPVRPAAATVPAVSGSGPGEAAAALLYGLAAGPRKSYELQVTKVQSPPTITGSNSQSFAPARPSQTTCVLSG